MPVRQTLDVFEAAFETRPPLHECRKAFEAELLPQLGSLYSRALRFTTDPSRAEDLVQDTLLKAFRSWRQFQPGSNIRSWLFTILRHTFINNLRRSRREPIPMDLASADPAATIRAVDGNDPEGTVFARIVDAKVLETIDTLQDDFREVVVLSAVENLSYTAIAGVLGIPVGTVKSRLFRARRQLQRALYDDALDMGYVRARPRRVSTSGFLAAPRGRRLRSIERTVGRQRAEPRLARCARGAPTHSIGR
jgi:RNA polymerase sigma-70 factor, ECF subfamily